MTKMTGNGAPWIEGELRLAGIDNRMILLLKAISETGSLSQAAKQCGLSYKGAWQIIERANNSAPKILISTAIGGSKGGGSCLTETGHALLELFTELQAQHRQFLEQLNQNLADNHDTRLLLQRLAVKTSVRNQLFGIVRSITSGAVNAEVIVSLAENIDIKVTVSLMVLEQLELKIGTDAALLINSSDIVLASVADAEICCFSASNRLSCHIIRIQLDDVNAEISMLLPNGEILASVITRSSANSMGLEVGENVYAMFNSNTPILGIK